MDNEKVAALVEAFMTSEAEHTVRDMAGHVGDEVHGVLKRHAMLMKTTAGAIAVGVLAAAQVLADTLEFARQSMEDDAERDDVTAGIAELFVQQAPAILALAREVSP